MRAGLLFNEIFWGALLILLGLSAILRSFSINIPIFRVFFAFLFIYIGFSVLFGHGVFYQGDRNSIIFSQRIIEVNEVIDKEYNIIFGSGEVDLTNLTLQQGREKIKINAIFGSGRVLIDVGTPVVISANSAFGSIKVPDGNDIAFGDITYHSPNFEQGESYLEIDASAVFGNLAVIRK